MHRNHPAACSNAHVRLQRVSAVLYGSLCMSTVVACPALLLISAMLFPAACTCTGVNRKLRAIIERLHAKDNARRAKEVAEDQGECLAQDHNKEGWVAGPEACCARSK